MIPMLSPIPINHDQTHYVFCGRDHFAVRHSWECFLRWRTEDLGALENCDIHRALEALSDPPPVGDYQAAIWDFDPTPRDLAYEVVIDGMIKWLVLTPVRHVE